MKPDAIAYEKPSARVSPRSKLADVLVLAKVRVNALVVATTAGGYYMAADVVNMTTLAIAAIGTALVASGAAAVNQIAERDTDKLMERTRLRPVADGRMRPAEAWIIAMVLSAAGLLLLWLGTTGRAALVALVTLVVYAMVYTPLKRLTSLATVVGAVPGALPPLIGWAAAGATLTTIAPWTLFMIGFLWQLPHVLAIAWIYRDEYARAGLPVLPALDRRGTLTGRQATLWAATLVPFSELPFLVGLTDAVYAVGALVLGTAQLVAAARFARRRSETSARLLFYASITYLPLLWLLMVLGRS